MKLIKTAKNNIYINVNQICRLYVSGGDCLWMIKAALTDHSEVTVDSFVTSKQAKIRLAEFVNEINTG